MLKAFLKSINQIMNILWYKEENKNFDKEPKKLLGPSEIELGSPGGHTYYNTHLGHGRSTFEVQRVNHFGQMPKNIIINLNILFILN